MFAVNADGTVGTTAVATGTTNDLGAFSVTIPADVLTFIVEVSGNTTAKTVDEATGADIPISETFKLASVVKVAAGVTAYTGSVTPLTDMVVKTALKGSGGLSSTNIDNAKSDFAAKFGFDPNVVKPIISNSAEAKDANALEKKQSILLAAISQMAENGDLGCATGEPAVKLDCVVKQVVSMEITTSATTNSDKAPISAINAAAVTVVNDTDINKTGNVTVDLVPTAKPDLTPVANPVLATKQLFSSLRSNLTALSNADKQGVIDLKADAMRADFDKATAPLDQQLATWMQMSTRAIDYLNAYKAGSVTSNSITITVGGRQIGGCGIYADSNGFFDSPLATSAANAVSVGCSGARKFVPDSFSSTTNTYKQVAIAFAIVPVSGSSTSYTYASRARIETWNGSTNKRNPLLDETVGTYGASASDRARGTIEYARTGATINNIAFKGMMPARTDAYGTALTDHEIWDVAASRTAEGSDLFKYALAGSITSVKASQNVGTLSIGAGSFLRTEEKVAGTIVASGVKAFSLNLAAEAGGSKVDGTLVLSEAMADKSGVNYQPTKIAFTGKLSTSNAEFFTGTLTFSQPGYNLYDSTKPESATNIEVQGATLLGKLSVPDRPALIVQLSGTRTRGASDKVSLTGQYNDGTNLVNLSLSSIEGAGALDQKVMTISSVNGVSITLTGAETVDVLFGTTKVAVLNTSTGRIDYSDGTFESLK